MLRLDGGIAVSAIAGKTEDGGISRHVLPGGFEGTMIIYMHICFFAMSVFSSEFSTYRADDDFSAERK